MQILPKKYFYRKINIYFTGLIFIFLGVFTLAGNSKAAPNLADATILGTVADGHSITISNGSGFGTKSPAKPLLWAPFDSNINPSSLGTVMSWETVEYMSWNPNEGPDGSGCAKANTDWDIVEENISSWALSFMDPSGNFNDLGASTYIYRKVKQDFDFYSEMNCKTFRMFSTASDSYPNFYINPGIGNTNVEGGACANSGIWMQNPALARGLSNIWRQEEIIFHVASGSASTAQMLVDGSLALNDTALCLYDANSPNMSWMYPDQVAISQVLAPDGTRHWVDDIYVDNTWARVMIGNAPAWSECTHKEIQIPSAWSEASITVNINKGTFSVGDTAYLYVVDSTGAVNETGYEIKFGSGSSDTTPLATPSGLSVS